MALNDIDAPVARAEQLTVQEKELSEGRPSCKSFIYLFFLVQLTGLEVRKARELGPPSLFLGFRKSSHKIALAWYHVYLSPLLEF